MKKAFVLCMGFLFLTGCLCSRKHPELYDSEKLTIEKEHQSDSSVSKEPAHKTGYRSERRLEIKPAEYYGSGREYVPAAES